MKLLYLVLAVFFVASCASKPKPVPPAKNLGKKEIRILRGLEKNRLANRIREIDFEILHKTSQVEHFQDEKRMKDVVKLLRSELKELKVEKDRVQAKYRRLTR